MSLTAVKQAVDREPPDILGRIGYARQLGDQTADYTEPVEADDSAAALECWQALHRVGVARADERRAAGGFRTFRDTPLVAVIAVDDLVFDLT